LSPALKPVVVAADLEANRSQTLQPVVAQPAQVASAYCARDSGRRLRTRTEEIRDGSVRRVLRHRQLRAGRLGTGLGGDFENKGWAYQVENSPVVQPTSLRCWVKVAVRLQSMWFCTPSALYMQTAFAVSNISKLTFWHSGRACNAHDKLQCSSPAVGMFLFLFLLYLYPCCLSISRCLSVLISRCLYRC
jgi:hypothetical protein